MTTESLNNYNGAMADLKELIRVALTNKADLNGFIKANYPKEYKEFMGDASTREDEQLTKSPENVSNGPVSNVYDTLIDKIKALRADAENEVKLNKGSLYENYWQGSEDAFTIVMNNIQKSQSSEIPVIDKFSNGRCSDIKLVQQVADVICKAIIKNSPNISGWRGGGLVDAANAVIDILSGRCLACSAHKYGEDNGCRICYPERESADHIADAGNMVWQPTEAMKLAKTLRRSIKTVSDSKGDNS